MTERTPPSPAPSPAPSPGPASGPSSGPPEPARVDARSDGSRKSRRNKGRTPGKGKGSASGDPRSIVFVGLMGAGKSCIGRRVAEALSLPFVDADEAIEEAAGRSIAEIFETFGEPEFRAGERRVIQRLMSERRQVIATGGGAFVDTQTRALILERAISIWLRADLETLMHRVSRRDHRPLLRTDDPRAVMERLLAEREPFYAQADAVIDSLDGPHARTVERVLAALKTLPAAPKDTP